jgi:pantetheine-phosphate adenylyltransferase
VSSRLIKGVYQLNGDVSELVPPNVLQRLQDKRAARVQSLGGEVPGEV